MHQIFRTAQWAIGGHLKLEKMNLEVCSIGGLYVELIKFLSFKRVYLHFHSIYFFYFLINLKGFRGFVVRIF